MPVLFLCVVLFALLISFVLMFLWHCKTKAFFQECFSDPHRDARFCHVLETVDGETSTMVRLLYLFDRFHHLCSGHGVRPILYAGALLGWYFDKRPLPWDDDIDLIVLGEDVPALRRLDGFRDDQMLIEINPHSTSRSPDSHNMIDGRVICSKTGRFLDIIFFFPVGRGFLGGKRLPRDSFLSDDLTPIQSSVFNGKPCFVPHRPDAVLYRLYSLKKISPCNHGPPGDRSWCFRNGSWVKMIAH